VTPLLLLFDIDGTLLLRAAEDHRRALQAGLREVYGIEPGGIRVETAGRTDLEIARLILLGAGVGAERIDLGLPALRAAVARAYAERQDEDLSDTVAPGMRALLDELAGRDDVRLALLTGNLEAVARMKLRRAGISGYFPSGQGAFGSDSEDRTMLPAVARRRAGSDIRPWPRERTVVIGDTGRDVACARADGCRCVAVATGPAPRAELAGADAVVDDARALGPALAALG
jgi:phosphoglycolate phosphatase-like HAD superfamily hydrolase